MTEENKERNSNDELARAAESLKAADVLAANGLQADAVSRLYYFVFHSVRALLLTKGLEPRNHDGALRLFSLHFVKVGVFTRTDSHLFSKMMKFREDADYNPSQSFGADDVARLRAETKDLCDRIAAYVNPRPSTVT